MVVAVVRRTRPCRPCQRSRASNAKTKGSKCQKTRLEFLDRRHVQSAWCLLRRRAHRRDQHSSGKSRFVRSYSSLRLILARTEKVEIFVLIAETLHAVHRPRPKIPKPENADETEVELDARSSFGKCPRMPSACCAVQAGTRWSLGSRFQKALICECGINFPRHSGI